MRRPLLWRAIEWHLGRHLTRDQLVSTLGDLAEDHATQTARVGRLRADVWLLRESLSVAGAYRARATAERRSSRRMLVGGAWADDLRFARRRLVRQPAASIVSVVTLACAIAAGAVTWSLLSALLLHPLPVASPDRLMALSFENPPRGDAPPWRSPAFLYPTYLSIRESGVLEGLAAGGSYELRVSERRGDIPQRRTVYFASHDYFSTLGVVPQLGRALTSAEDQRGGPLTAVLSDRYWRVSWDADPNIVGRTLTVLEQQATIVGVAPRGFRGLNLAEAPDLYLPFHAIGAAGASLGNSRFNSFAEPESQDRNSPSAWVRIVGRLKPGESADQTRSRLDGLFASGGRWLLTPVNAAAIPDVTGAGLVPFTRLLTVTVALLVLVGCLTVSLFLLVRTEARRDELAMCLALGGTRAALARGIVFEGALLTAAGVLLALPIASGAFSGLSAFQLPGRVEIEGLGLALDRGVWLAIAVCATGAMLLITLVAAALGVSPNVADVLRARAGGTPRVTRRHTRGALVATQVAIALVLLAGAGLFARSLVSALTLNTGFDAGRMVTGTVSLAPYGYTDEDAVVFFDELRRRLDGRPEIDAVAMAQNNGGMSSGGTIAVNGIPRRFPTLVSYMAIDERYFSTLGLSMQDGRNVSAHDTVNTPLVAIVSSSFGRVLAGGATPLGYRLTDTSRSPDQSSFAVRQVTGVVPDVIVNVNATEPLAVYYPLAQQRLGPTRTLAMRARADAASVVRAAMRTIRDMDPLVEPGPMLTIEARLAQQMHPQRLGGFVLGSLGGIACLLTLLGAYVLAESMSSGRRRELGIRATLGASRIRLGGLILADTVRLVGIGLAAGLLLAWFGASTIRSFLFRIEPLDPVTLGGVAIAILVLTLVVSLRPAIDAARVDLAETLRNE